MPWHVEVQLVDHPSRLHLDIEADDIEAETDRLVELGAEKIANPRRARTTQQGRLAENAWA